MPRRTAERLQDMIPAIDSIHTLLENKTFADLSREPHVKAALERYFEVLSEASRHVPVDLQESAQGVDWRDVADIGNIIHHAYHRVDTEILWNSFETGELAVLREVCVTLEGRFTT